jgi:hypothetical protein
MELSWEMCQADSETHLEKEMYKTTTVILLEIEHADFSS